MGKTPRGTVTRAQPCRVTRAQPCSVTHAQPCTVTHSPAGEVFLGRQQLSIHHWRYGCSLYAMSHTPCWSRLYVSLLLLCRLLTFPPSSSTKSMILTSDFSYNHLYKWALLSCLSQNWTFSPNKRTTLLQEQNCYSPFPTVGGYFIVCRGQTATAQVWLLLGSLKVHWWVLRTFVRPRSIIRESLNF